MGSKADTRDVLYKKFVERTGMNPPADRSKAAGLWWKPLSEMALLAEYEPARAEWLLAKALEKARGITIKSPMSIMTMYKNAAAQYTFAKKGGGTWSPLGSDDVMPETDKWSPL